MPHVAAHLTPVLPLPGEGRQLTQLLPGEPVTVQQRRGPHLLVECPWQPQWSDGWRGYRGWVRRYDLRSGEALYPLPAPDREAIVRFASKWLETEYEWGGLGERVDCSGLVHRAYRSVGLKVPRDSSEMYRANTPLPYEMLQRADLLYLSNTADPGEIDHVMLYLGEGMILEASGGAGQVQRVPLREKLEGKVLFHGSFLTSGANVRYSLQGEAARQSP